MGPTWLSSSRARAGKHSNFLGTPWDRRMMHRPCSHNHYHSYEFYVPEMRAYRISASAQFFPTYCELPVELPIEAAARTAAELLIKLKQHHGATDPSSLSRHQQAMKIINSIYEATKNNFRGWKNKNSNIRGWNQRYLVTPQRPG
jgi:hypothetical protein